MLDSYSQPDGAATARTHSHQHQAGQQMAPSGDQHDQAAAGATTGAAAMPSSRVKAVVEVFCLVPGCGFNLTDSPYYLKRHRVCEAHMKAKTVTLQGVVSRFCQQCGRFQPLSDFNGERKSCDAALKAHNARRRQMNADSTVLVNDRRARGISSSSRRSLQKSASLDSGDADGPAPRVSRRLAAHRSSSFRSEDLQSQQQQQHKRLAAAARRETRSDGDQACCRGSKSPSASLQSFDDLDSLRHLNGMHSQYAYQQQQQQDSRQGLPGCAPGSSTTPPSRSASPGTAGSGSQHATPAAASQVSMGSAAAAQQGASGRSRLGMMATSCGMALSIPQAYAASQCLNMECSPCAPPSSGQQGTLGGWMAAAHSTPQLQQQLQQAWMSGAGTFAAAGGVFEPYGVLANTGGSPLSMQQQQQALLLQQQQWQPVLPGTTVLGPAAGSVVMVQPHPQQQAWQFGTPLQPQPAPAQHAQFEPPKQQQPQQQDQAWLDMLLADGDTGVEAADEAGHCSPDTCAAAGPAALKPASSPDAAAVVEGSSQQDSLHVKRSGSSDPTADAGTASGGDGTGDLSAGTAAAASSGAAASAAADELDAETAAILAAAAPPDDALDEALSMLDVMLAADPDWQEVQESAAAASGGLAALALGKHSTSPIGSNSAEATNNPSGRLSDLTWVSLGPKLDPTAAAAAAVAAAGPLGTGNTLPFSATQPGLLAAGAPGAAPAACPMPAGGLCSIGPTPAAAALLAQHQAGRVEGTPMSPLHAASLGLSGMSDPGCAAATPAAAPAVAGVGPLLLGPGIAGMQPLGWGPELSAPGVWNPRSEGQSKMMSPGDRLALLQQEQLLAEQQLLQQQELQRLHFQQRQQLLQQQAVHMQHQLVRLSVKLHGVTPDQLPSSTLLALEQMLQQHAGHLDAVMLQPGVREGCVQLEFDVLVKPQGPLPLSQHQQQQQEFAGLGGAEAAGSAATCSGSGGWAAAVVTALGCCPANAAAEAELRGAVPFSLLLEVLLSQPLVADSTADTESVASRDSLQQQEQSWGSSSSDASDDSSLVQESGDAAISSRVHAVYAQLGDCMGIWTAGRGLVQDWTPIAGAEHQHPPASQPPAAGSSSGRPCILDAGRLCIAPGCVVAAAPGAGAAAAGAAASCLQLELALHEGCSEPLACFANTDDTHSHSDSSSSSLASVGHDSQVAGEHGALQRRLQVWCTCRDAFIPTACRPKDPSAAARAGAVGRGVVEALAVGVPSAGLLQLQIEQGSASGKTHRGQQHQHQHGGYRHQAPLPVMSALVPVVVCPSADMAAEVESVLRGLDASTAGHLLQRLGLVLDLWAMQQELTVSAQRGLPLTHRQQWSYKLLGNAHYLQAVRSFCQQWLLLARQHTLPATGACLSSIWSSLTGTPAGEADAAAAGTAAASSEDGVCSSSSSQQHTQLGAVGRAASTSASTPAAERTSPRAVWVFEDAACSRSVPGRVGPTHAPTAGASSSPPGCEHPPARARLWPVLSVLAVVVLLLALKLAGGSQAPLWLPLLHSVRLLMQAIIVPLAVMAAGGALAVWVLREDNQGAPPPAQLQARAAPSAPGAGEKACMCPEGSKRECLEPPTYPPCA